jgi:hypothetical protein
VAIGQLGGRVTLMTVGPAAQRVPAAPLRRLRGPGGRRNARQAGGHHQGGPASRAVPAESCPDRYRRVTMHRPTHGEMAHIRWQTSARNRTRLAIDTEPPRSAACRWLTSDGTGHLPPTTALPQAHPSHLTRSNQTIATLNLISRREQPVHAWPCAFVSTAEIEMPTPGHGHRPPRRLRPVPDP